MRTIIHYAFGVTILLSAWGAQAGCYAPSQELPSSSVAQFVASPASVLQASPSGGARLITTVRDLVATNESTLPLVLGLISSASPDQRNAIATALAQAARICLRSQAEYASKIQQDVAGTNNQEFAQAFAAASGDLPTGATGGGAGGGGFGGGIGGPISFPAATATNSTTGPSSSFFTPSSTVSYFTGVTGSTSLGSSSSTTNNFITAAGSVSP